MKKWKWYQRIWRWITSRLTAKDRKKFSNDVKHSVIAPELKEMIANAMKPERIIPYDHKKGRVVWNSRQKGTYVKNRNGELP